MLLNRLHLTATIAREIEFKLNPGGTAVLTLLLRHQSQQTENSLPRQVNLNIVAKIIGPQALLFRNKIAAEIQATGFLSTPKLGFKNVVFHIETLEELNKGL